jgi:two-component system, OmpR family, phosphate regulon response regulator PhoB
MRIACVEDNEAQSQLVRSIIEDVGYECVCFDSGESLLRALRNDVFDLYVLDWRLPGINGDQLLAWIRNKVGPRVPILFLTSNSSETSIVSALSAGADDYMIKPVRRAELIARLKAILRRVSPAADRRMCLGPYVLDELGRSISLHGILIELTPREFDLAALFFRNIGRLVPRDAIEMAIWGRSLKSDSRTLDTHIARLRIKLMLRHENGVRLVSVYSRGFRLMPAPEIHQTDAGGLPNERRADPVGTGGEAIGSGRAGITPLKAQAAF